MSDLLCLCCVMSVSVLCEWLSGFLLLYVCHHNLSWNCVLWQLLDSWMNLARYGVPLVDGAITRKQTCPVINVVVKLNLCILCILHRPVERSLEVVQRIHKLVIVQNPLTICNNYH